MITEEDFISILKNKKCLICKDSSYIIQYNNVRAYDCQSCKIFYFGNTGNMSPTRNEKYFGYRYKNGIFVFRLQNSIKTYYVDDINRIYETIDIVCDKIPESIEDLHNIYNIVQKIKVFK